MPTLVADPQVTDHTGLLPDEPPLIRRRTSWDEYLALPEYPKAEWINGEAIIMMADPTIRHMEIADNIAFSIRLQLPDLRVIREAGFRVSGGVRRPDVIVLANQPNDIYWISQAPLVIVEVFSPSTRSQDLVAKATEYAEAGAKQYWLIDPDEYWLEVRENIVGSWHRIAVVDECNPSAEIEIGDHGTVQLTYRDVFH